LATSESELFDDLSLYTLSHGEPRFLHQHAVDAYAVQSADSETKTIAIFFGLMGLYLFLEHGFTGRQVQLAHMRLAKLRRTLPRAPLPAERGAIKVADVLAVEPGAERDAAIEGWCQSVWSSVSKGSQQIVREFLQAELGIAPPTAATRSPRP
jgi:hypothetical protein